MKVLPFKIRKSKNIGLLYQEDIETSFYDKLHQHEEIQLSNIIKGEGTLIVGDTISSYKSGDVLVIGSNLPHVFKSDRSNIKKSLMVSLFFTKRSFGKNFFSLDDFKELNPFFKESSFGLKLLSNEKKIQKIFLNLRKSSGLERFIGFFEILKLIENSDTQSLAGFLYPKKYTDIEGKRMRDIMDFTMNNFDRHINLDEIANQANLVPNAFCRYFKQRTNKTYFSFLNEFRIDYACRLLSSHNLSIGEIACQCGFKNLSNFNRKFKKTKNITPSDYRKNIEKKMFKKIV